MTAYVSDGDGIIASAYDLIHARVIVAELLHQGRSDELAIITNGRFVESCRIVHGCPYWSDVPLAGTLEQDEVLS